MEALVPAFLLAMLTQIGERPTLLTAILADRYRAPLRVALAAGVAQAVVCGLAAVAGAAVAPILTPAAHALLLGLAIASAGLSGLWPAKGPGRLGEWQVGRWGTALLAVFALTLFERGPFITFAIASGGLPWFAAAGSMLGAFAVLVIAAVLGEQGWLALPLRRLRAGLGIALLIAGAWLIADALRLL